jgi:hypothetical protein
MWCTKEKEPALPGSFSLSEPGGLDEEYAKLTVLALMRAENNNQTK